MTKRTDLLTSGGDCGGLTAVIRAVALRAASSHGCVPLAVAIAAPHCVDPDGALLRTARGLGICLGDE
jgi:hypothetical protein